MITNLHSYADLIITPFFLILVGMILYILSRRIRNKDFQRYFLYGSYLKLAGSIAFGIVYATYYGGDTAVYWKSGNIIGDTFWTSPTTWFKLLFHFSSDGDTAKYISKLYWYKDSASYFPCQVAGLFSPFCFGAYSTIAIFFAVISFSGLWHLFLVFNNLYPTLHRQTAISIFFLPSLIFWGSGIMKDPLVLAGLGWLTYGFYFGIVKKTNLAKSLWLGFIGIFVLFSVKPYVIACFFPPMMLWVYSLYIKNIKNVIAKLVVSIFAVGFIVGVILLFFNYLGQTSGQNVADLGDVTNKINVTNRYILRITGSQGSGYYLGENDGTVMGSLLLAPQAIYTTLFRPFIWEAKNVTMLLAAMESTWFVLLTLYAFYKVGIYRSFITIFRDPTITFCFIFSLFFCFIVGISSGNFGTLVRYKIPMMPFYIISIYALMVSYKKTHIEKKHIHPVA